MNSRVLEIQDSFSEEVTSTLDVNCNALYVIIKLLLLVSLTVLL